MSGCGSVPKAEIVLPPKPQREELTEIKTLDDVTNALNYYEHLVQKWELWGESVECIVKNR